MKKKIIAPSGIRTHVLRMKKLGDMARCVIDSAIAPSYKMHSLAPL